MTERVFVTSGDWALGADSLQWILYRKTHMKNPRGPGDEWRGVSFVSSDRAILERCIKEKGCPEATGAVLLANLPETFKEWKTSHG